MIDFTERFPVLVFLALTIVLMSLLISLLAVVWLGTRYWLNKLSAQKKSGPGWFIAAYILAILPPLLWLMSPAILAQATQSENLGYSNPAWSAIYSALRFRPEDWFMLPLAILFLVFIAYLLVGIRGDQSYKDIFLPRRFVWFVFGLVVLFVAWFVPKTLLRAESQFTGMHVNLVIDTDEAIDDLGFDANCLDANPQCRDSLLKQVVALRSSLDLLQASIGHDPALIRAPLQAAEKLAAAIGELEPDELSKETAPTVASQLEEIAFAAEELHGAARQVAFSVTVAQIEGDTQQEAQTLLRGVEEQVIPTIYEAAELVGAVRAAEADSLESDIQLAQDALLELQGLVAAVDDPGPETVLHSATTLAGQRIRLGLSSSFGEQTRDTILRAVAQMQVLLDDIQMHAGQIDYANVDQAEQQLHRTEQWRVNEVQDKIRALEFAAVALEIDPGTPLLMVALLFIVLLLIPWLLFISFIVGKREQIINDRLDFLADLNMLERIRTASSLLRDPAIEGANRARTLDPSWLRSTINRELFTSSLTYQKAFEMTEQLERSGRAPTEREIQEINRLADSEILNRQTFHSREYLIPLLILTALTLVGWYFTIFADGTNGLVRFIEQGGGSLPLNNLLAQFTPFTMVFAGAWLFMIIMLTYRWVSNDLYPGSYFYASMRLVYGLLVGMVFLTVFRNYPDETAWFWLLLAFFVGTAPVEFVDAIWRWMKDTGNWVADSIRTQRASEILKYFNRPEWASRQPLTVLEDLTVWDDVRFNQEGIQNVHALATADLARLAMRTPYDAQTLVDWVDQAVLRIHTKVLWHAGLTAIGIRGATDLIHVCGVDQEGNSRLENLNRVVGAFNAAQLMSLAGDPRFDAYNETTKLETAGTFLAGRAKAVKELNARLDPAKEETLDKILALRRQVQVLSSQAAEAISAREAAYDGLGKIVDAGAASWASDSGELDRQLKTLKDGNNSLIALVETAVQPEKMTRDLLESDQAKGAGAERPAQVALKAAQDGIKALLDPVNRAKRAVDEATQIQTVMKVKSAVDTLQKRVDELLSKATVAQKQAAGLLKANYAEAMEKLDQLSSTARAAESATSELMAAGEAGGDAFTASKVQAKQLKEMLGTGSGQLQEKIATAKDEVAKVAKNAKAIKAAKDAIHAIAEVVGTAESTGGGTVMGKMKDISGPWKDIDTKLTRLVTAILALNTAATQANTLSQSIKKDDASTWDNVKALASLLSGLRKAVAETETARSDVEQKLEKLNAEQTLALREAQKKVTELSVADAREKTEAVERSFRDKDRFLLSAGSPGSELGRAKTAVESAVSAAEKLSAAVNAATEEARRAVLPLRLTQGILEVILGAIHSDPNIHSVLHYWEAQINKAKHTEQLEPTHEKIITLSLGENKDRAPKDVATVP